MAQDSKPTRSKARKRPSKLEQETRHSLDRVSARISNRTRVSIQQIDTAKENALSEITGAQAIEEWQRYYRKSLHTYELILRGRNLGGLDLKGRWGNFKKQWRGRLNNYSRTKRTNTRSSVAGQWAERSQSWYIVKGVVGFGLYVAQRTLLLVFETLRVLWSMLFAVRTKRMFWFLTLAGVLIFQAIVIFAVITDTPVNISFLWLSYNLSAEDIQSISSNLQKNWFFLKLSAVLGLILVPALGYAFANKNYRIYSNLLEQYRHRATVAATLEGILEQIKQDEANKDIRDILTATAAHAMFEHKAIGHLSKKENEASALSETLAIIGTRK